MTTIAGNRKLMASDSKVSIENKGIDYPTVKIIKRKGTLIGAAGHGGDCTRFIKWASTGFNDKEPKWNQEEGEEDSVIGMVIKEDGIYIWTQGDPEPEKVEADFYAVGSGGKAARAAMLMGATPTQAVEIACKVDPSSAPPVQVIEL